MVDYVSEANELLRKFRAFSFSDAAPAEVAERLQTIPGVAADVLCEGAELLYANYDRLPAEGKRIAAEMFNYALHQGWTTFNQGDRSELIVQNIAADIGDRGKTKPPEAVEWPEPRLSAERDWRKEEGA
jgi:hypothetical protein